MKRVFREAKKLRAGGEFKFRKWDEYDVGDIIIGEYLGEYIDPSYKKRNRKIKVEDAQIRDKQLAKELIGKTLILNHCGLLDSQFEGQVSEGDFVQVEYEGTSEIKKGPFKGKDAHQMTVSIMEVEGENENEETEEDSDDEDENYDI